MIAAIAAGDVNDVFIRLLVTVIAAIDMKTGAIEMCKAGRESQAFRRGRGNEAVEFCHATAIEGIQGPTQGSSLRCPGGIRGEMRREVGLFGKVRHEVEWLVDRP